MNHLTTRKVEKTMEKAEKVNNIARKKAKAVLGVKATVTAIILGGALSAYGVYSAVFFAQGWFQNHRIQKQAPIVLQWPLRVEAVQVATTSASPASTVTTEPYLGIINEAYRKVRFLESTAGMSDNLTGTHAYCQSIGKVNEIGYLVDGDKHFCFADYGEQFLTFKRWMQKRLPDMSLDEALCVWNTGTKQPMCNYSVKYHSL